MAADYEVVVTVEDGDRYDEQQGLKALKIRRDYSPTYSVTNVERMSDKDLRTTRDAINEYLGES